MNSQLYSSLLQSREEGKRKHMCIYLITNLLVKSLESKRNFHVRRTNIMTENILYPECNGKSYQLPVYIELPKTRDRFIS